MYGMYGSRDKIGGVKDNSGGIQTVYEVPDFLSLTVDTTFEGYMKHLVADCSSAGKKLQYAFVTSVRKILRKN